MPGAASFKDSSQADFLAGSSWTNIDPGGAPGALTLPPTVGQQNTSVTGFGYDFNSTAWAGQTFIPVTTGPVPRIDLCLYSHDLTGIGPDITVSIRATTVIPALPTGEDLATATISGFNIETYGYHSAFFATPPTLVAGRKYAVIFRASAEPAAGSYAYVGSTVSPDSNPYVSGQWIYSNSSGDSWGADTIAGGRDLGFKICTGFFASGSYTSSVKDGGPSAVWTSLAWTASMPSLTSVKFQIAASNSSFGPYDFVGPDGTADSFFTYFTPSGISLQQFNGMRYLQYRAFLASSNPSATPFLEDVTLNYGVLTYPEVPLVTNATVNLVTKTTAVLGGTVTGDGGGALTARGVVYSLTSLNPNPQIGGNGVTNVVDASAIPGVFSENISNLTRNTSYTFAAYATNRAGTSYTSPVTSFATVAGSNIATLSALTISPGTLTGTLGPNGGSLSAIVSNSTTSITITPTVTQAAATVQIWPADGHTAPVIVPSGTASPPFPVSLGVNVPIHVFVTADDGVTALFYDVNITRAALPSVDLGGASGGASQIIATAATLGGNVTDSGGVPITDRGIVYTVNPTNGVVIGAPNVTRVSAGAGTGSFTIYAAPLLPGTEYAYQSYATNAVGTSYSGLAFFTTRQNNADLAGLTISAGTLSPAFNSIYTTYNCDVPNATTTVTVTPTKAASGATIRVNGVSVASGDSSAAISVPSAIQVEVTAQDNTRKTYTISVSRPAFSWTYNAATDVPLSSDGYTASGQISLALNFAPQTGTTLTVVRNTSLAFISGAFYNFAHGQSVTLAYNGINYPFVVNYYGGSGNDLVLQWANVRPVSWGWNNTGQLGNNSTTNRRIPGDVIQSGVLAGKTIISVAVGAFHSLALCSDGTLAAWGQNGYFGTLGNNGTTNSSVPVAVDRSGVLASKTIVAISAGSSHSLVLCSDGTLVTWGSNDYGQLGNNSLFTLVPVAVTQTGDLLGKTKVSISAFGNYCLALCSDGTIVGWGTGYGTNSNASSAVPVTFTTISGGASIYAGSPNLLLRTDGTALQWGASVFENVNFGATVQSVAAGGAHSLALLSGNYRMAWGANSNGQLGDGSTTYRATPGDVYYNGVLLGKTVKSVAAGALHSLALCTDGTLTSWGFNSNGQLGNNDTDDRSLPVAVNTTSLASGERFMILGTSSSAYHNVALVASPAPLPTVATLSAGLISATGATLRGTVNAQGTTATVAFEYGTTSSYGTTFSATPGTLTGSLVTPVTAAITGLQPDTTYHYRVTSLGVTGADMTFITRSAANPAPPGAVDGTFNPSIVVTVNTAVPLSDGRILVGGSGGGNIARLNADGSQDGSFTATTDNWVTGVALQPEGKVLICGGFQNVNGVSSPYLARLNADGVLESSATFNPPTSLNNRVYGLLVLPNGKIMVHGDFSSKLMRLNADGTQDSSFTALPDGDVTSMALQPDGKLILCGNFSNLGGAARAGIARLNPDGSLESTSTFNVGTGSGDIYCVAVQADGKILIGGAFAYVNGQPRNRIARLNPDGSLESNDTFNMGTGANNYIYCLALQADGHILIGGWLTNWNGTAVNRYARIKSNGTLDSTSEFELGSGPGGAIVNTIALKKDGKILIGGTFDDFSEANRRGLVQLNNDSAPQSLTVPDTTQVLWSRAGSSPEFSRVVFELSTDGGGTWTSLGAGTHVGTTSDWQLTGLSLPAMGNIRARGYTTSAGRFTSGGGILVTSTGYQASPPVSLPLVSTPTSSNVGTTAAVLGGTVVSDSGAAITERGVVYATTATNNAPQIGGAGVVKIVASASGIFTVQATSLASNTGYSFKAYATSAQGTGYTNVSTFTTLNSTPMATAQSGLATNEDTPKTITLAGSDADGDALTFAVVATPAHGSVSIAGSTATYTPGADYNGNDSFTFMASDPFGGTSAPAAVSLTVIGVNDLPSFAKGGNQVHPFGTNTAQSIPNWATSISDGDDSVVQALSFNINVVSGGSIFTAVPSLSSDGTLTYTPNGSAGTANLTVTLTDDTSAGGAELTTMAQTFTITIKSNNALNFDGVDDSVNVPNGLPVSLGECTIEMWIKPSGAGGLRTVMAYDGWAPGYLHLLLEAGTLRFALNGNTATDTDLTSVSLTANTWHHVAMAYSSSAKTLKWYVNGNLVQTNSYTIAVPLVGGQPFKLGSWNDNERFLSGTLDEFRIWSVARTQAEIQASMVSALVTLPPELRIYYPFDEGIAGGSNAGIITLPDYASTTEENGTLSRFALVGATSNWIAGASLIIPTPEITVSGNSISITDGDTTPSTSDHTGFGSAAIVGGTVQRTFTISNVGLGTLSLGSVTVSGPNAADFNITTQPLSLVAASGTTTFQVTFDPSAPGLRSAKLSFATNDSDENPFNFSIQGTGYDSAGEAATANYAASYGLSGTEAAPTAEPFNDGVSNLLKYAFNMPLTGPNIHGLTPGSGTNGLPAITAPSTGGPPDSIRVEFIRRRNSGLIYTPLYSINGLANFTPMTATPAVTTIDTNWERVVVLQPLGLPLPTSTFSRVSVAAP